MRKFLQHDTESGELRLVYTDLWDGRHERTEYRVIGESGKPVHGRKDLDGATVHRDPFGTLYVRRGGPGSSTALPFGIENAAVGPTVKTACRRLASKSGRARCALCTSV